MDRQPAFADEPSRYHNFDENLWASARDVDGRGFCRQCGRSFASHLQDPEPAALAPLAEDMINDLLEISADTRSA